MPSAPDKPRAPRCRTIFTALLAILIFACAAFEIHRKTDHLDPARQLSAPHWRLRDDVDAARYAKPYDSLRHDLRGVKSVGFVPTDTALQFPGERMIAQSMLVPTLVVSTPDAPLVIAAFTSADELEDFLLSHPFTVRRHLGGGQALLQRDAH